MTKPLLEKTSNSDKSNKTSLTTRGYTKYLTSKMKWTNSWIQDTNPTAAKKYSECGEERIGYLFCNSLA